MIVWRAIRWAFRLIREGHTRFLLAEAWMRFYKAIHELLFWFRFRVLSRSSEARDFQLHVQTDHPVAFKSPDHLIPWGTMRDNSTNKKFVSAMKARIEREQRKSEYGAMDLGCSGGQLVRDFRDLGWMAVGLEGSDFSLKHGRANWPALAGKNLFTCDITKPFQVTSAGKPARFDLITAWEVLEHIPTPDIPMLFTNIVQHMKPGGYFVASTTSVPDIHDGVDLHQTKWPNAEWRRMIETTFPELEPVDLGLRYYQFVRHNEERSFLCYRRRFKA
jgi:SAM-dependent methyltransferase